MKSFPIIPLKTTPDLQYMNYTPLQQEQLLCFKLMQCQHIKIYAKVYGPPIPTSLQNWWSRTPRNCDPNSSSQIFDEIPETRNRKRTESSLIPKLCVWGMVSCWPVFENIATEPKYKFQAQQCFKNQNHNKIFLSRIDVSYCCYCSPVENWILKGQTCFACFH